MTKSRQLELVTLAKQLNSEDGNVLAMLVLHGAPKDAERVARRMLERHEGLSRLLTADSEESKN
jgi:hypothetical protein